MAKPITNVPVNKAEHYHKYADVLFAIADVSNPVEARIDLIDKLMAELDTVHQVEIRADVVEAAKHLDFCKSVLRNINNHKAVRESLEKANLHLFRVQMKAIEITNKPPRKEDWE